MGTYLGDVFVQNIGDDGVDVAEVEKIPTRYVQLSFIVLLQSKLNSFGPSEKLRVS